MQKKEIMQHLASLGEKLTSLVASGKQVKIPFGVVPYKHKGTTYFEDGIRITGSQEFIDAVLMQLNPIQLLSHENGNTRLQIVYNQSTDKETGQKTDSYVCSIQVHERGGEAKMANAIASSIAKKEVIVSKGY